MEKELISVIVPVYNAEKYLQKCLDSILEQTYQNLEIIIINDGSIDNSGQICQEYEKQDDRIIYIEKENSGVHGGFKPATSSLCIKSSGGSR